MLSEEEKKAIEILNHFNVIDCGMEDAEAVDVVLNLIETQQKEIEELKDKFSDEKIRNTVIKRYREVIEKDYISKDKIKEKIKYIEDNYSEHSEVRIGKCIEFLDELLEE